VSTVSPIFGLPAPELDDAASIETAVVPLRDRIEAVLNAFLPVGVELLWPGAALPVLPGVSTIEFQWADGGLLTPRDTTYATFLATVGHAYNNGVDPGSNSVRKPDKRGRASIGPDAMGGGAAAGRLSSLLAAQRLLGQSGGLDSAVISAAQRPNHSHQVPTNTADYADATIASATMDNGDRIMNAGSARSHPRGSVAFTENNGSSASFPKLQPYEIDNVIVRVR
jgi:microcystin-dependent protein